jgi:pyridoxal phosphate enzyme (YggS family)
VTGHTLYDSPRSAEIAAGLADVRERIDRACAQAGRPAGCVTLVVVTKTFPSTDVRLLHDLGCVEIAENKDQEARQKVADLGRLTPRMRWHMIGQVQRNKARAVATWADVVESVDRLALAQALSAGAVAAGRSIDVLLQVSLDPEPADSRGGVRPADVPALSASVAQLPGLVLRGVMGIAPYPGDPDRAFMTLESVAERLVAEVPGADVISAGMSADLEEAIRHGATQVRVGGAVLGKRTNVR